MRLKQFKGRIDITKVVKFDIVAKSKAEAIKKVKENYFECVEREASTESETAEFETLELTEVKV